MSALERQERLKGSSGIALILRNGKKLHGRCLGLYFNPSESPAYAVLVKKKIGTAVQRNKAKRWIREIYRKEKHNILFPFELLFVIDKQFTDLDFAAIKSDIHRFISQLNKQKP